MDVIDCILWSGASERRRALWGDACGLGGILFKPSARSAPKWMRFAKACGNKALKRLGRNRFKLKQARSRQSENDRVG